ncbi:MAG: RIP metalloprotease RseP [Thermodesulfobacteriota bacterium]
MLTLTSTLVLLGLLIFVHELGHFLAAKALGVRVERFSLGFPPKMIGRRIGETEYMLSWIPLGGYVKMFGEHPGEEDSVPVEERPFSFSHQPTWARFLIVTAGPAFNFIFAFLVFWVIYASSGLPHLPAVVGRVAEGRPAALAGIAAGDRITTVNGRPVQYFDQVTEAIELSEGRPLEITFERQGRTMTVKVIPELVPGSNIFGEEIKEYDLGLDPFLSAHIGQVQPGLPADLAGLMAGDKIIRLDSRPVRDWYDVLEGVQTSRGRKMEIVVERGGRAVQTLVTPRLVNPAETIGQTKPVYRIGIERRDDTVVEKIGPLTALYYGAVETWGLTKLTVISVVKLVQAKLSVKTLGGPIFIAELAGKQAKAGLLPLLRLAALLSLNLGILNLLPIPVLDGGHIFFFFLEAVFRRPISLRIRERAQQAGLVFLLLFMAFIFYNDLSRLAARFSQPTAPASVQHESPVPGNVNPGR